MSETDGEQATEVSGAVRPLSSRRRLVEIVALVLVPLAVFVALYFYGPEGSVPEPDVPAANARDVHGGEVLELRNIRRDIEASPEDVEGARTRLAEFVVECQDAALAARAAAWRAAIDDAAEEREYVVRPRRYRLSQAAYERALHPLLEPGEPDVYLRVWRTRDGQEELVYDGAGAVREGWTGEWTRADGEPSFRLTWKIGEPLRVELREADTLGDNVIATYAVEKGLGILLLSVPRISQNGHVVELESDFAFGQ